MVPMLLFAVPGGLLCAAVALPHGLFAAFLAYALGGALFALIPGLVRQVLPFGKLQGGHSPAGAED